MAVALLVLLGVGQPARATITANAQATESTAPALSILSQSSWVPPSGTFDLSLHIDGASPGDRLDLAVFPRITTRARFDESIKGENLGRPLDSDIASFDLTAFPTTTTADGTSGIVASIPISSDETPPFGVRLYQAGVYPVRITVTDATKAPLTSIVTHLLRLPSDSATAPLAFSMIVPVHAPPALQPDGTTSIDPDALNRIDAALDAVKNHPAVPLTFAPTPETVDALAATDNQTGDTATQPTRLTRFANAARSRQILGQPFVDLDLGAWVAAPSPADTELNEQLLAGAEVIAARVGVRPDTRTVLADRTVTSDALTRFSFTGTNQLVIPQSQLVPLSTSNTAAPFETFDVQDSNGQPIRSIATNDALVTRLTETPDAVLNGHLVLADLALTWITTGTEPRGTVLSVPADLTVPTETYDAILDGLSARSDTASAGVMVSPVNVDDLFRITGSAPGRGGNPLVRDYEADVPRSLGTLPADAADTRSEIASYRTMLRTDTGRADGLDRRVLVSEAAGLSQATSDAYLDGASQFITDQFSAIVAPDRQRVTLTAENGELPITVENALDYEVQVVVSIASVKLEFPEGNSQTVVLPPGSTRVTIPVSSRTTGAFPVEVSVRTPDEQLKIASARFTVRSTAISGIGLILSISAGAFLLLWWGLHFRKTRRAKRLVDSNHPTLR